MVKSLYQVGKTDQGPSMKSTYPKICAFWDSFATESDTFFCVKNGSFPNHTLDTSHTTISHIDDKVTELNKILYATVRILPQIKIQLWIIFNRNSGATNVPEFTK